MRLTCPNCGAQYEVPAEVIPETGRDVQCSECGTTWFQHHPDHPAAENIAAVADPEAPSTVAEDTTPDGVKGEDTDATPPSPHAEYTAEEEGAPEPIMPSEVPQADLDDVSQEETTAPEDEVPAETIGAATKTEDQLDPGETPESEPDISDTASEVDEDTGDRSLEAAPAEVDADDKAALDTDETREADVKDAETNDIGAVDTAATDILANEPEEIETETEDREASEASAEETLASEGSRRRLDESVKSVLQQEAERETQARAEERSGGLETQPELGLTQDDSTAQQRSLEAEARMARLRGDDALADDPASDTLSKDLKDDDLGIDPSSRSNLLPDIDEINSSLDPQNAREAEGTGKNNGVQATASSKGSGFRTGFRLAVLVALIGLLLYVFAPQLASNVPQLEGPLSGYVGAVDGVRAQLDGLIEGIVDNIDEPASE